LVRLEPAPVGERLRQVENPARTPTEQGIVGRARGRLPTYGGLMEYTLIDVDSHITEAPDTWVARVPAKYRDRVPRVERRDGEDVWLIDGERATTVGPTAPAGWTEPMPTMPRTYEDLLPAAYDAKARLELLDEIGIW